MKIKIVFFALLFSVVGWGQTIFQFDFESGTTPSIDNAVGTPTYSTIGTLTSGTGVCNGTGSITHSAWNTNDGYRFTVNTTGYSGMNFSYVERTSNVAISTFIVRASTDGTTWSTIRASYTPPTTCTTSGSIALPATFDNQPTVYIEILKNVNAGNAANTFRIDDVTLTGTLSSPCTTPTTQPTALTISGVTSSGANGSYTAATAPGASGYLVVYSLNNTLSAADLPTNGITYTAGNTIGDGTVGYVGSLTNFSLTGLTSSTTYHTFVFAYNSGACATAYNTTSPLAGSFTTTGVYCASSGSITYNTSITNVNFNTINNTSAKPSGYSDYTAIATSVQQGSSHPLNVRINTDGNYTVLAFAWIDFNQDSDFNDPGEAFDLGSTTNSANGLTTLSPLTINIPLTASIGATRMRVIATYDGDSSPCLSGFDGEVEDYTINITPACTPTHTVSSFVPNTGSTGTDVTITGTGFTAGTTIQFNGITAVVTYVNATTLVATVPSGTTTGAITVTEGGCKLITGTNFTQIVKSGTCSSGNNLTDLIISEVYDSESGNSWYMELYNPTGNPINLNAAGANYKLVRYGDIGTTTGLRTVDISGVIPAGGVYYADLGTDSSCGALAFNYSNKGNGINENDEIRLTKNDVTVDIVHCPNEKGYSIRRKAAAVGPSAVYSAADWDLFTTEDCTNLGIVPFSSTNSTPTVSISPTDFTNCGGGLAGFNVTATASGAGTLTYQWFYNTGLSNGWNVVAAGSFAGITVTGITSNALSLSGNIISINGYQFYCQVTQNGTCAVASDAAQVKIDSTIWFWDGSIFKWSNGAPTLSKAAIINGNYTTVTNGSFSACSVTVNATFTLTISPNTYVEIQNGLTNNGAVDVQNNGSLVQISDAAVNSGSISVKRDASQRKMDYVYWSSPVQSFPLNYFVTTGGTTFIYKWETLAPNPKGTLGNWVYPSETNMTVGKGYIVRGNSTFNNAAPTTWTANFTGTPNNGIVPVTLDRGGLSPLFDDNWSLIGNPYPSAIDADSFIARFGNNLSAEYKDIEGSVRLWTHTTLPTNTTSPFYQNFSLNYYPTDYITYNSLGSQTGPATFNGKIASGQSFLVLRNDGATANATTLNFDNALRSKNHNNSQFFKQSDNRLTSEKSRIWLDLVLPDNNAIRTLVGYVEGATLAKDNTYDAYTDYKNEVNFYSLINNEPMIIQGRPAPFDVNDQVPVGFKLPTSGSYKIAIATVDGLFSDRAQKIYLEDKLLNVIHEISQSPYQFTTESGIVNDRFILRFTNQSLATNNFELENTIKVFGMDNSIKAKSTGVSIKEVTVYNVLGQKLAEIIKTDSEINVNTVLKSNQALVVKVVLENGQIITKKLIF